MERNQAARAFRYVWHQKRLLLATLMCTMLGSLASFLYPWLIGALIDNVIAPAFPSAGDTHFQMRRQRWLLILGTIGIAAPLLHALAGYGRGHFNLKMGNRVVMDIRRDLLEHIQRLPMSYFSKSQSGSTVWTLMHEVHGINGLFHGLMVVALVDSLHVIIAIACLFSISGPMTAAILLLIPIYYSTFRFFNPRLRIMSERVQRSLARMSGKLQEALSGMAVIKSYDTEGRVRRSLEAGEETHFNLIVRHSHLGHMMGAMGEMLMHVGTSIIIVIEGYLAIRGPNPLTAGEFTRYLGYVGLLYGPLARFAGLNATYQNSLASLGRVFSIFDIPCQEEPKNGGRRAPPDRGEVVFDEVSFHYGSDIPVVSHSPSRALSERESRLILKDVSLKVQPGELVGIIGPSGCGKTTLVSLIPRLYDATTGSVRIDGTDVRDYTLEALRKNIATVQQESFLFSGTVRENLLFARPEATEQEIRAAAKAANADDFIQALPHKYSTVLGERGITLSGGQRQRLSIARALLRNPRILILDEATSALDADSEFLVQDALNKLMKGRTCFIIAHRLSTIQTVDRIIGLCDGQIVEAGSHGDLLSKDGLYTRLMRRQMMLISPNSTNDKPSSPAHG